MLRAESSRCLPCALRLRKGCCMGIASSGDVEAETTDAAELDEEGVW